ncbi:hypothetical protein K470DRAFT_255137, partial [Piedraia hortae CBS 480.64]
MVHRWGTNGSGLIIYCLFVPAFALLSLLYLIPASTKEKFAGHRMIPLALDVLNTLLFLTAAIAFTVKLGAKSCKNSVSFGISVPADHADFKHRTIWRPTTSSWARASAAARLVPPTHSCGSPLLHSSSPRWAISSSAAAAKPSSAIPTRPSWHSPRSRCSRKSC